MINFVLVRRVKPRKIRDWLSAQPSGLGRLQGAGAASLNENGIKEAAAASFCLV